MVRCKALEVLRREAYFVAYVDRRRTRETKQMTVFQQPPTLEEGL